MAGMASPTFIAAVQTAAICDKQARSNCESPTDRLESRQRQLLTLPALGDDGAPGFGRRSNSGLASRPRKLPERVHGGPRIPAETSRGCSFLGYCALSSRQELALRHRRPRGSNRSGRGGASEPPVVSETPAVRQRASLRRGVRISCRHSPFMQFKPVGTATGAGGSGPGKSRIFLFYARLANPWRSEERDRIPVKRECIFSMHGLSRHGHAFAPLYPNGIPLFSVVWNDCRKSNVQSFSHNWAKFCISVSL